MSAFGSIRNLILIVLLALLARKILNGYTAMNYVRSCHDQVIVDKMLNDADFKRALSELSNQEMTFVLILNQHALNMTLNWLCNTQNMHGIHESAVIVTLDEQSDTQLARLWPRVRRINFIVPCLRDPFGFGDGRYQLLSTLRANLVNAFLTIGKPFWMIQQDTFWRRSLLTLDMRNYTDDDVIFDRSASDDIPLIAGGYFFVRPTVGARKYFKKLAEDLKWWYAPDNCYMAAMCAKDDYRCGYLPFSTVTNWIWFYDRSANSNTDEPPILLQFDGDTKAGGKLGKMQSLGLYFLKEDGFSCDPNAVQKAGDILQNHYDHSHSGGDAEFAEKLSGWRSNCHWQFDIYQHLAALMYKAKFTESILNFFLPYAHYLMITI